MLVAQVCQHQVQINCVFDGMHRHTQNLAIDPQLLVGADAVTVGGDEGQFLRPKTHHAARRQFGRGSGLANAGRPHQGVDAALFHQGIFVLEHGHLTRHGRLDIVQTSRISLANRQLGQQVSGQARTEPGAQQGAQQLAAQRVAALRLVPCQTGQLLFNHAAHRMNFAQYAVAAGTADGRLRP